MPNTSQNFTEIIVELGQRELWTFVTLGTADDGILRKTQSARQTQQAILWREHFGSVSSFRLIGDDSASFTALRDSQQHLEFVSILRHSPTVHASTESCVMLLFGTNLNKYLCISSETLLATAYYPNRWTMDKDKLFSFQGHIGAVMTQLWKSGSLLAQTNHSSAHCLALYVNILTRLRSTKMRRPSDRHFTHALLHLASTDQEHKW